MTSVAASLLLPQLFVGNEYDLIVDGDLNADSTSMVLRRNNRHGARVVATDPRTRRAFATYWFFIRPSSGEIRREVLRTVAHRAESQVA